MAEIKTELRPVVVQLRCDECGVGEMKHNGVSLMSNPPQFPHICDNCGVEVRVRETPYPRIVYVYEEVKNETSQ